MKWIKRLFVTFLVLVFITPFAAIELSPQVQRDSQLSEQRVSHIKSMVSKLTSDLRGNSNNFQILISHEHMSAISDLMTISIPRTAVDIQASPLGVYVSATADLMEQRGNMFANVSCLVINDFEGMEVDHCRLGKLYFPGAVVEWLGLKLLAMTANHAGTELWYTVKSNSRAEDEGVRVANLNLQQVKQNLKSSIQGASSIVGGRDEKLAPLVATYLDDLQLIASDVQTLEQAIFLAFRQVGSYTQLRDPENISLHNEAAIWALAIVFANPTFADLIGIDKTGIKRKSVTLQNRDDLALHFLYSAILEINGGAQTALNIGELKEVMDSMKGGTGYSFADLVADKAGIQFAAYLRNENNDLESSALMLVGRPDQSLYMLPINQQPEGLSNSEFKSRFGSINSPLYKKAVGVIQSNIDQLPLYR